MAEIPKDTKFLLFGMGARWHATLSLIVKLVGLACLIVGIIGAATDKALGLGALNWLVSAVVFWIWGLAAWLCAYFCAKEG
jgi:hypothetical protein